MAPRDRPKQGKARGSGRRIPRRKNNKWIASCCRRGEYEDEVKLVRRDSKNSRPFPTRTNHPVCEYSGASRSLYLHPSMMGGAQECSHNSSIGILFHDSTIPIPSPAQTLASISVAAVNGLWADSLGPPILFLVLAKHRTAPRASRRFTRGGGEQEGPSTPSAMR